MSSLSVTLVQTDLHWENPVLNCQQLDKKIRSLTTHTEIVVLPEMFSTGFTMETPRLSETMDGMTVGWMRKIAAEKKIILTGSLIIREGDHYFNRLVWMLPNGQYGVYDKRHLFGYAGEDKHYTPGTRRLIASVNGWKVNLQVCYDLRFPAWARNRLDETGQPEYDVLIYVANWPERRNLAWKTLLRARSIENQCYVIGVNRIGVDGQAIRYAGDSMVVDPLGDILYERAYEEDVATIVLQKSRLEEVRGKLPFLRDADHFDIAL